MTSLSKHFMATDLCYRQVNLAFLGAVTMVVCLKHVGIIDCVREKVENVSEDNIKAYLDALVKNKVLEPNSVPVL
jgi:hypothetical protein